MTGYLVRRVLAAIPALVVLTLAIFVLAGRATDPAVVLAGNRAPDGNPTPEQIAEVRSELGLDRALPIRYGRWVGDVVRGDLGRSLFTGQDVGDEITARLPATIVLALVAVLFASVLALPLGILAALVHRRWPDHVLRVGALAGASLPAFFVGYLLIALFAVKLRLLPVAGIDGAASIVLPALTLALGPAAVLSRLLRSSLLETFGESYIRLARAKGLSEATTVLVHALRNAVIPVVTVLGAVTARLLEGAVIVEIVFAWPGVGLLTYDAIVRGDHPVIAGTVLLAGVVFLAANLAIDLSYGRIDPRVRIGATT